MSQSVTQQPESHSAATESWAYRAASRWWTWTWTGTVWALLCLPVVTAPAATLWIVAQEQRCRHDEPLLGWRASLDFFRARLWVAWRLAVVHLAALSLVAIALFCPVPNRTYGMVVGIVGLVVGVTWGLLAPWSVISYGRELNVRAALRQSYQLAVTNLPLALCSVAAILAAPVTAAITPHAVTLLVWPVLPALATTIVTALHERASIHSRHPHESTSNERQAT